MDFVSLGIDVISTASVLAFAMDLYERGILSSEDTDGIELTWGNAEAMETMMHHIAQREGFGAVLAEGVQRAAQIIGRGAAAYAYHSKGLELTAYDPRGGMGTALGYAVSTRGGDFLTAKHTLKHFRDLWQPTLFSRQRAEYWVEKGSERLGDRLREKTVAIIEEHQPEPLPENVQEEIDYILQSG